MMNKIMVDEKLVSDFMAEECTFGGRNLHLYQFKHHSALPQQQQQKTNMIAYPCCFLNFISGQTLFGSGGGQAASASPSPFKFQSSQQPNPFSSNLATNVQQPTFNFGASAPVLGGNTAGAANLTASPAPSPPVFQFGGNQQASSSSMFSFSADQTSSTTASKVDLKKRVIKKAARKLKK